MTVLSLRVGMTVALPKNTLNTILERLREQGFQTLGPRIEAESLVYSQIKGLEDLPQGYTTEQNGGNYRLIYTGHPRYFDITAGSHTWKQFLFPPRVTLFTLRRNGKAREFLPPASSPRYALIGVRPCDLAAIGIQDRVFLRDDCSDPIYRQRRHQLFILTANCFHPAGTCFCVSMETGPKAKSGFDLSLTELEDVFLFEIGSELGRIILLDLPCEPASAFLLHTAQQGFERAERRMGRNLDTSDLPDLLLDNTEHPHWQKIGQRCLSCTNCTQVCPTCFCWDTQEHSNLKGDEFQRVRVWDSCFNPGFSYQAGGNTRPTISSRYRQWLTHKFAAWKHQFDTLGCVGCGRCITWCPVGIDVTEEIPEFRKEGRK